MVGLLLVFVAVQFIRPARNESRQTGPANFFSLYPAPQKIQGILVTACFDCHSNHTDYPWYAEVQPMGWWLAHHINEGKQELNFNEFGAYPHRRQLSKLKTIRGSIRDCSMPLSSYTLIHTDAKLTEEKKKTVLDWLDSLNDSLATAWRNH